MRYRRAVEKIRILAEACQDFKRFPSEEPFLLEAYVFGDVLRGVDPLDFVEVALVLNLLPVPGLDGFGILRPWLPYLVQGLANQYGQLGILAVFAVLWFVAPVSHVFFQFVVQLTSGLGIDQALIVIGQMNMRFR